MSRMDDYHETFETKKPTKKRRRQGQRGKTKKDWDKWASNVVQDMINTQCFTVDLNDARYSSLNCMHPDDGFVTKLRMFTEQRLSSLFWESMGTIFQMVQVLRLPRDIALSIADVDALCTGASAGNLWGLNLGECRVASGRVVDHLATMLPITKIGWLYVDDSVRQLIPSATRAAIGSALSANRSFTHEPMPRNKTTLAPIARKHGIWDDKGVPMASNPTLEKTKRVQQPPPPRGGGSVKSEDEDEAEEAEEEDEEDEDDEDEDDEDDDDSWANGDLSEAEALNIALNESMLSPPQEDEQEEEEEPHGQDQQIEVPFDQSSGGAGGGKSVLALAVFEPYHQDVRAELEWKPDRGRSAAAAAADGSTRTKRQVQDDEHHNLSMILGRLIMELIHAVTMRHIPEHNPDTAKTTRESGHTKRCERDVRVACTVYDHVGAFPSISSRAVPGEFIELALQTANYAVAQPSRVPGCKVDRVSFRRNAQQLDERGPHFTRMDVPEPQPAATSELVTGLTDTTVQDAAAHDGVSRMHARRRPNTASRAYNTIVSHVDEAAQNTSAYALFRATERKLGLKRVYDYTDPRGDRWVLHAAILHSGGYGKGSHFTALAADTVELAAQPDAAAAAHDGEPPQARATYAYYDGNRPSFDNIHFEDIVDHPRGPRRGPLWSRAKWKVALYVREQYALPVRINSPVKWVSNNCWLASSAIILAAMQPRLFRHWRCRAMAEGDQVNVWQLATIAPTNKRVYVVTNARLSTRNTASPVAIDTWQTDADPPLGTHHITRPRIVRGRLTKKALRALIR
jgi:hypothetical protein